MGWVRGHRRSGHSVSGHYRRGGGMNVVSAVATVAVIGGGLYVGSSTGLIDSALRSKGKGTTARSIPVHVARVVDGDTFKTRAGLTVRVIGIDTPETVHPDKPVECGGPEASRYAARLLENVHVRLVFDSSQERKDRYGRTLAYVEFDGDRDYGLAAILAGHAREATYGDPYARQDTYRDAADEALDNGAGIWSMC